MAQSQVRMSGKVPQTAQLRQGSRSKWRLIGAPACCPRTSEPNRGAQGTMPPSPRWGQKSSGLRMSPPSPKPARPGPVPAQQRRKPEWIIGRCKMPSSALSSKNIPQAKKPRHRAPCRSSSVTRWDNCPHGSPWARVMQADLVSWETGPQREAHLQYSALTVSQSRLIGRSKTRKK